MPVKTQKWPSKRGPFQSASPLTDQDRALRELARNHPQLDLAALWPRPDEAKSEPAAKADWEAAIKQGFEPLVDAVSLGDKAAGLAVRGQGLQLLVFAPDGSLEANHELARWNGDYKPTVWFEAGSDFLFAIVPDEGGAAIMIAGAIVKISPEGRPAAVLDGKAPAHAAELADLRENGILRLSRALENPASRTRAFFVSSLNAALPERLEVGDYIERYLLTAALPLINPSNLPFRPLGGRVLTSPQALELHKGLLAAGKMEESTINALGDMGTPEAAELLIKIAETKNDFGGNHYSPWTAQVAARALGRTGMFAGIPTLKRLAEKGDSLNMRLEAMKSLGKLGDPETLPFLQERLLKAFPSSDYIDEDDDDDIKQGHMLLELIDGFHSPDVGPTLLGAMEKQDNLIAYSDAATRFARREGRAAVAPLASLLQRTMQAPGPSGRQVNVGLSLVRALGETGAPEARTVLEPIAKATLQEKQAAKMPWPHFDMRAYAVESLGKIDDPRMLPFLQDLLLEARGRMELGLARKLADAMESIRARRWK